MPDRHTTTLRQRKLCIEPLEVRQLLNADWGRTEDWEHAADRERTADCGNSFDHENGFSALDGAHHGEVESWSVYFESDSQVDEGNTPDSSRDAMHGTLDPSGAHHGRHFPHMELVAEGEAPPEVGNNPGDSNLGSRMSRPNTQLDLTPEPASRPMEARSSIASGPANNNMEPNRIQSIGVETSQPQSISIVLFAPTSTVAESNPNRLNPIADGIGRNGSIPRLNDTLIPDVTRAALSSAINSSPLEATIQESSRSPIGNSIGTRGFEVPEIQAAGWGTQLANSTALQTQSLEAVHNRWSSEFNSHPSTSMLSNLAPGMADLIEVERAQEFELSWAQNGTLQTAFSDQSTFISELAGSYGYETRTPHDQSIVGVRGKANLPEISLWQKFGGVSEPECAFLWANDTTDIGIDHQQDGPGNAFSFGVLWVLEANELTISEHTSSGIAAVAEEMKSEESHDQRYSVSTWNLVAIVGLFGTVFLRFNTDLRQPKPPTWEKRAAPI